MNKFDFILEWLATAFILVGAIMTIIDLVQYGMIASFIGSVLFLIWSMRIKKLSFIIINGTFIAIYGIGIFLN